MCSFDVAFRQTFRQGLNRQDETDLPIGFEFDAYDNTTLDFLTISFFSVNCFGLALYPDILVAILLQGSTEARFCPHGNYRFILSSEICERSAEICPCRPVCWIVLYKFFQD